MWCRSIECHRRPWRNGLAAAVLCCGAAVVMPAQAQGESDTLATLGTVYVANAGASWFATWLEEKEQSEGSLFRPNIKEVSGDALLQGVVDDPASVGLLSKAELQAAASAVGDIRSARSGLQVCMAIAVRNEAAITEVGDLALLPLSARIVATSDTIAIFRSLLDVHQLGQRLSVSPVSRSDAVTGLSTGNVAAVALPVESDGSAQLRDDASQVRFLSLSDAAARAVAGDGFVQGSFSTNRILGVSLASSIRTVCDEIMIVSSASGKYSPERLARTDAASGARILAGGGLLDRVRLSLNDLWNVIVAGYQGFEQ